MSGNDVSMEAVKAVVRHYVECFNAGDLEGLRRLFAEDAMVQGVLGWGPVQEVTPIWRQLMDGLGMQLEIEDMVAEGNRVAVRYRETGVARAPFFDKPATGRRYELVAMEWFLVRDGRIQRRWGARDAAAQARQLGWDEPAARADGAAR